MSGATVTVPAGYYASQASKTIASATLAEPVVEVQTIGPIAQIVATVTQSTGGYIASGSESTGSISVNNWTSSILIPSNEDE